MTWTQFFQTCLEGALGGLTFGIYHSVVTERMLREARERQIKGLQFPVQRPQSSL